MRAVNSFAAAHWSGIELVLAFLAGVVMGGALDRFVLPLLVDAWIDKVRRHDR